MKDWNKEYANTYLVVIDPPPGGQMSMGETYTLSYDGRATWEQSHAGAAPFEAYPRTAVHKGMWTAEEGRITISITTKSGYQHLEVFVFDGQRFRSVSNPIRCLIVDQAVLN